MPDNTIKDSSLGAVAGGNRYDPYDVYYVKPNDTLSGIAVKFGVTVEDLCVMNRIKNPDLIEVDQRILIPR